MSISSCVGITSILSGTLVNDFRFSHMYWQNRNTPAECEGALNANCIGAGGPEIFYLNSVNFALGNNFNSPQGRDLHRYSDLGQHDLAEGQRTR